MNAQPISNAANDASGGTNQAGPTTAEPTGAASCAINQLVQRYGQPCYKTHAGLRLNQTFWAAQYAADRTILYEPDERTFYGYEPATGLYVPGSHEVVRQGISDMLLNYSRSSRVAGVERQRSLTVLNGIVSLLSGITEKRGAFTTRRSFVHLANGVIDLTGGSPTFRPFSPDFNSRNASPIKYEAGAQCSRFLNELLAPVVEPDDVILLQKIGGLFLLGENLPQRIVVFDGESGLGKTQLAIVFQEIVGRPNVTQLRTKFLGDRFELYRYLRRTLLVGVDVEPDFLATKGASVLKGLVGGDWFDAEQKGGTGSFPLQGKFNVLITSNARLRVHLHRDAEAWRRRLVIVRFGGERLANRVPNFGDLLVETEGPGILNWMLEGARLVLADIQACGDLVLSDRQHGLVDSLIDESDSLRVFLRERVESAEDSSVSVQDLLEAYGRFCRSKGWMPIPAREVSNQLEGLMLELFGVAKSHSLGQIGHTFRGFRYVAINEQG